MCPSEKTRPPPQHPGDADEESGSRADATGRGTQKPAKEDDTSGWWPSSPKT